MQENRVHFKEFVLSLLSCDAINEQQGQAAVAILSLLLDYLEKGTD
jgi:cytochrome c-type biogenesis protein CcmH/NrfG